MTTPHARDEIARTLRQLRTEAGLTLAQVGLRAGVSGATVSRLENGRYVPTPEQAEALAQAVGARATVRRRLVRLAGDLRERTAKRQVLLRAGAASAQKHYGEIEAASGHVQTFSPSMVPGLLQVEAYARVVFRAAVPAEQVEDSVTARLKRQLVLRGEGPPVLTQVLAEGALLWQVGSPGLMAEQCEHLAALAAGQTRARIGVVPRRRVVDVFPMHSFDLYDERAVIVGTITGTAFLTSSLDVAEYVRLFKRLTELAVFGEEALPVLERIAEWYRSEASRADPQRG